MGVPKLKVKMSVEDYLESEKHSEIRHEYIDGEIYAMSGATRAHDRIWFRIARRIADRLDGTSCEPVSQDVKLYIRKLDRIYYPDLAVVCDNDIESDLYITKPVLVVEISSPSTAATDRREKLFAYQEIESLQEYLMIDQDERHAELYRRRDDGLWSWITYVPAEDIELESIGFSMPLDALYDENSSS